MEHSLDPRIAFCIVPLFALAKAGVDVRHGFTEALTHPAAQGVTLGLLAGKPLGVFGATWLCARGLRVELPSGVTWRHLHGAAWPAGIGFTMSLFVDGLAFAAQASAFDAAKIAVLAASLLAGAIGFVVLRTAPTPSSASR